MATGAVGGDGGDGARRWRRFDGLVDGLRAFDFGLLWRSRVLGYHHSVGEGRSGCGTEQGADQSRRGLARFVAVV